MITGAHCVIYSIKPDQDRAFMRDVLKLPCIDAGGGWLIFGLPPAEVAFHDSKENNIEEFYLLCDDIDRLVSQMKKQSMKCSTIQRQHWGLLTKLRLPGGGDLKFYQPLHARPKPVKTRVPKK